MTWHICCKLCGYSSHELVEIQEHLIGIHNLTQSDLMEAVRQQISPNHYLWSSKGQLIMEAHITNQEQPIFQLPEMVTLTPEEAELIYCPPELAVPEDELDVIPDINDSVLPEFLEYDTYEEYLASKKVEEQ